MKARVLLSAMLLLTAASAPFAQQAREPEAPQLPVRRVILYKSGVGFFEHQGSVTGSVDVAIQFTSAQLNDVLKSLTAIDLDNGRISSIGYNSVAPLDQRLSALRVPLGMQPDLLQFYNALRGARVEVRTGASTIVGRLLGIERKAARDASAEPTDVLTVVSNNGAVRTIVLRPSVTVRIAEPDLREDIGRYLSVVASGRDQDVRRMTLAATGDGTRRLLVSYVSEVPIWKSTYRLVLPGNHAEDAVLQGWAIVDNTVGADWTNVELSLVAGAPQSFIQQVSQPYYARRPVVPLPQMVQLVPQTHSATLQAASPLNIAQSARSAIPPAVVGMTGGFTADRAVSGRVMVDGRVLNNAFGASGGYVADIANAQEAVSASAVARDLGDLFEYRLSQPVTIRTNQSAMVPIANARVAVERVSLWNRTPGSGRPLRAVWLTNTSGLTLDGGSLSVVDGNAFAGEGLVEPLKPGEKRLISYGSDLGVIVDSRLDANTGGRFTRVIAHDGIVTSEREFRNRWTYRIRNEDSIPRTLIIEHPVRQGWTWSAELAPVETTATSIRFHLPVAARGEATVDLSERSVNESRITIEKFDDGQFAAFTGGGVSADALRQALQPLLDARARLASADRRLTDLNAGITSITSNQDRIRQNIQALGSSRQERALRDRYTRELNAQEDRLQALQKEIATATVERDQRRADLSALMQRLTFEVIVK